MLNDLSWWNGCVSIQHVIYISVDVAEAKRRKDILAGLSFGPFHNKNVLILKSDII